jgi:site-specific recombinase XerD
MDDRMRRCSLPQGWRAALSARGQPMIKRAAERAGVNSEVSAHWLRHAHASHALGRGATVGEVRDTLGHANVATTSAYLHASPDRSSGLVLDEGIFR